MPTDEKPEIKKLADGTMVKVGSSLDPDTAKNRIAKAVKKARSPGLRAAVVASQKKSLERGGKQRPHELSAQHQPEPAKVETPKKKEKSKKVQPNTSSTLVGRGQRALDIVQDNERKRQ